jgi:hypothetical protein
MPCLDDRAFVRPFRREPATRRLTIATVLGRELRARSSYETHGSLSLTGVGLPSLQRCGRGRFLEPASPLDGSQLVGGFLTSQPDRSYAAHGLWVLRQSCCDISTARRHVFRNMASIILCLHILRWWQWESIFGDKLVTVGGRRWTHRSLTLAAT